VRSAKLSSVRRSGCPTGFDFADEGVAGFSADEADGKASCEILETIQPRGVRDRRRSRAEKTNFDEVAETQSCDKPPPNPTDNRPVFGFLGHFSEVKKWCSAF